MSSSDKETDEIFEIKRGNFGIPEELLQECLTSKQRLEIELEQDDQKCNYMKFEIENAKKRCSVAQESTQNLQNVMLETQKEITEIREEVVNQKKSIENKCSNNKVQYYSEIIAAVSRVRDEYKYFKAILDNEIARCDSYDTEFTRMKENAAKLLASVVSLKNEEHSIINRIETEIVEKIKTFQDTVTDDKIDLLKEEFAKYKDIRKEIFMLEQKKRTTEEECKQISIECQKIKEENLKLLNTYENLKSIFRDQFNDIRKVGGDIAKDLHLLKTCNADEHEQIDLMINKLECEINNLRKRIEILKSEKDQFEKEIPLRCQQIQNCKADELRIEGNKEALLRAVEEIEKKKQHLEQDQLEALERSLSAVENENILVAEEISLLEAVEFSNSPDEHLVTIDIDLIQVQSELDNLHTELETLESEEVHTRAILERLSEEAEAYILRRETVVAFTKQIEHLNSEAECIFAKEVDEINQHFNAILEDISAYAIETYEEELILDELRGDLSLYNDARDEKQFELWSLERENEKKSAELEQLNKNIIMEQTNRDLLHNLLRDLEKNSFPSKDIPDSWFQSFEKEKKMFDALHKERVSLEKEKNLLVEKHEGLEYRKYKSRQVGELKLDLNSSDADECVVKKKPKLETAKIIKERTRKKNA